MITDLQKEIIKETISDSIEKVSLVENKTMENTIEMLIILGLISYDKTFDFIDYENNIYNEYDYENNEWKLISFVSDENIKKLLREARNEIISLRENINNNENNPPEIEKTKLSESSMKEVNREYSLDFIKV